MMSKTLFAPIVWAFARQGGKVVLAHLGVGTELVLVPEPENPYDPDAIRIEVDLCLAWCDAPGALLGSLDEALADCGLERAELVAQEGRHHLGYIPRTGGKPLEKARAAEGALGYELSGNAEFQHVLQARGEPAQVVLELSPSATAIVKAVWRE